MEESLESLGKLLEFERTWGIASLHRCDPTHRLFGESIEGNDRKFDVFFFGVFNLVVTDSMETLNKHHDGRNT